MSHITSPDDPDDVHDPDDVQWRKSNRSVGQGVCVELAVLPNGELAVRNSNRKSLGAITFSKKEMAAFIGGAKDGDFDDLL